MFDTLLKRQKYKAIFLIREHGSLRLRKKKAFNPMKYKGLIKYKKNVYNPILNKPTYIKGLKSFYAFEINGKQITIKDNDKTIKAIKQIELKENDNDKEAGVKDLMYANEVIKQIFQSLEKRTIYLNWIHLVLSIGLSVLIGMIIGNYIPLGV